jgi:excisionase family DNA binding protein
MKGYLTTLEAAKRLGVSDTRIRQMLRDGVIIGEKFGRSYMVPEFEIERLEKLDRRPGRPKKDSDAAD